ncbi:MAG: F0F1 ATP synthase subunit B [Rhodospirillaceae bacterium]|nr:F0F1 ATP synthase subunit B [Rhodospirillaceae bacterium]
MELFHDPEFWVALVFIGVVALFYRPAMKAVGENLDARAGKIRAQIEEARKLREEAQALLAEYQRKQRDAMAEAEKIIATARAEAVRLKADAEKDLEFALERRKQQALERIAQSEAQAVAQVRNTAVDVALAAAEKLIQGSLDQGKRQALADKAIAELPSRLN